MCVLCGVYDCAWFGLTSDTPTPLLLSSMTLTMSPPLPPPPPNENPETFPALSHGKIQQLREVIKSTCLLYHRTSLPPLVCGLGALDKIVTATKSWVNTSQARQVIYPVNEGKGMRKMYTNSNTKQRAQDNDGQQFWQFTSSSGSAITPQSAEGRKKRQRKRIER